MVLRRFIFTQGLSIAYFLILLFQMSQAKSAKSSPESRSLTEISLTEGSVCWNFSIGDPVRKEFFSPNYPNLYPKSTKCTNRITAPAGHTVMLDFRDKFHLENSANCDFDRLEVRDGAYGYSPLLGRFCGNEFPSKLLSTKRYMWLLFSSDDSIEYEGFKAVYDFIPMPNIGKENQENDKECSYTRSGPSGLIKKAEINPLFAKYDKEETIECMWTIEADPGKKIYMNFNKYQLDKPNDCDMNFIQIFEDGRTPDKLLATFCGTTAEPQKTKGNITHIRLFTHRSAFNNTDFVIHFTTFRELAKTDTEQCDPKTEFNCNDQTCVDLSLKCDGEFDCKYRYDEEASSCATALGAGMVLTSEHMIVILVVFFSLVIAMCASISISCYNKIKERQVREREYKERRSKEASVEATIDRNLRGHSSPDRISDIQKRIPQQAAAAAANFETPGPRGGDIRGYADDEESSDGCYVPEVDLSVFKHPNGGQTIPKKPKAAGLHQQYPYISESFESLESDVIVPPAPPPVPLHMKERRDISPPPPTYRIVGGKVVANPGKNEPSLERMQKQPLESSRSTLDSKGGSSYGRWPPADSRPGSAKPTAGPTPYSGYKPIEKPEPPIKPEKDIPGSVDPKSQWLRGPLEAGAPRSAYSRSPGEISLPKFGMARVTPDGPRGPLAASKMTPLSEKGVPLATFRSPYEEAAPYGRGYRPAAIRNYQSRNNPEIEAMKTQASIESSDKDSNRAHSVASSTLSAPDVIGKR